MHKLTVEQEAAVVVKPEGAHPEPNHIKIATFRRGSGVFFRDFPAFIVNFDIREIVSMCQSESEGYITLTIAYR